HCTDEEVRLTLSTTLFEDVENIRFAATNIDGARARESALRLRSRFVSDEPFLARFLFDRELHAFGALAVLLGVASPNLRPTDSERSSLGRRRESGVHYEAKSGLGPTTSARPRPRRRRVVRVVERCRVLDRKNDVFFRH